MEEKVAYVVIKVWYRTDGTSENCKNTIQENCDYNITMPNGYGIEVFDTELVEVE